DRPKSAATRSKRATDTSPQFSAPTTTSTAAMTSSSFIGSSLRDTLQPVCSAASEFTLVQIRLLVSKIGPAITSRVNEVTVLTGNVTDVQTKEIRCCLQPCGRA